MDSLNPNELTLSAYNHSFKDYIFNTPDQYRGYHTGMLRWIDYALLKTPRGGKVLEIGSATPRDANYIRKKGYQVKCSDAAISFVTSMRLQGEKAIRLDVLVDPIPKGYDLIFANAVVPHFTRHDFERVLQKLNSSLDTGKLFAFSAKEGLGESWITEKINDERYTHYWQLQDLKQIVESNGFEVLFIENGIPGDLPIHSWIGVVAKKA